MKKEDIDRIDKNNMYDLAKSFVEQLSEGKTIAEDIDVALDPERIRNVVVAGMGGSAIAGDLLRCLALKQSPTPVFVNRSYGLPGFVNEYTLVIISSFSGNTEETLSAYEAAIAQNAFIIAISSGGTVERIAREHKHPYIKIPGGIPPRAALGYSLSVLLVIANQARLISLKNDQWDEAIQLVSDRIALYSDPGKSHLAMDIAIQLKNRFPVIYSSIGMMEAINVRWRGQIEENSKKLAAGNVFPELNHNEIMGWDSEQEGGFLKSIGVIVLRDGDDHSRIQHRIDVTRNLLSEKAGFWMEVESTGESELARMLSVITLGDWVSLYLAYLRDVDPTPIGLIDKLKGELSKV